MTLLAKPTLGLPWSHCARSGYLFAGISPAVVVPSMLALQDHGRGVKAGVPALAITAASVDVVYAIAGFGVASSWLPGMGAGGAAAAAWQAPTQIVGGALGGVVVGKLLGTVLPPEEEDTAGPSPSANATSAPLAVKTTEPDESAKPRIPTADGYSSAARAVALMALVQLALFAGARWEFSGGAALLSLVMSTAAAQTWGPKPAKETGLLLNAIWAKVGEPLLFGLIGAAVDASRLKADVAGFGILTLAAGLAARCVSAFFAAKGGSLTGEGPPVHRRGVDSEGDRAGGARGLLHHRRSRGVRGAAQRGGRAARRSLALGVLSNSSSRSSAGSSRRTRTSTARS